MSSISYKSIIIPSDPDAYSICNVDITSAEMLTLALICKCKSMLDMLEEGRDLHKILASLAFNIPEDKVDKETQRQPAKQINYLSNYKGGVWILRESIIKNCGIYISIEDCQRILDARFELWPEIPQWWEDTWATLEKEMTLTNLMGRSKAFFEHRYIERKGKMIRNPKLEKNSLAWQNQSTVADITKKAQIRLLKHQEENPGLFSFLLEVHDSLMLEYKKGEEKKIRKIVEDSFDIQIDAGWKKYTLPIDLEFGRNYGEVK